MKLLKHIIYITAVIIVIQSCGKEDPTDASSCTDGIQNGTETGIDCGGNCGECLSSESDILDVVFADSPGDFDPVITIDNNLDEVYISIGKVFPTSDITNLSFDLELSDGAMASSIPSNYTEPQTITITAEDGTRRDYLFIVTGAYGTLTRTNGVTTIVDETRAIYQRIGTLTTGADIIIDLSANTDIEDRFYYRFYVTLKNKSFSNSLLGDHDLKTVNSSSNGCGFTYPTSTGGIGGLGTPQKGTLKITKHDMQNKLISGQILDLKYAAPSGDLDFYPYAKFVNVRYQ